MPRGKQLSAWKKNRIMRLKANRKDNKRIAIELHRSLNYEERKLDGCLLSKMQTTKFPDDGFPDGRSPD